MHGEIGVAITVNITEKFGITILYLITQRTWIATQLSISSISAGTLCGENMSGC